MRLRFAPNPSGELHVGNIHTALFNWLLARHHGGTFILRLEDTDRERAKPEAVETIYRDMRWLGLDWDEGPDVGGPHGPYLSSGRSHIYRSYLDRLEASGHAYRCYCTPEDLKARGLERGYDRHCRDLPAQDRPYALRLRMPGGDIGWTDMLRGRIVTPAAEVFDRIIARTDGSAVYLLAVVCDDIEMGVTHVVRGVDLMSATSTHLVLFQALGAKVPEFAHLNYLMGPGGQALSKRHGSMSIGEYRAGGYLPETIVNYLALLGWSSPSQEEVLDVPQIVAEFDLDRVNPANVVYDPDKLRWLNQQHLMRLDPVDLEDRVVELAPDTPRPVLREVLRLQLVQARVETLVEIPPAIRYLHERPTVADDLRAKHLEGDEPRATIEATVRRVESIEPWTPDAIRESLLGLIDERGLNRKRGLRPLFVAISGSTVSLPLFESIWIVGRDEALDRLRSALG